MSQFFGRLYLRPETLRTFEDENEEHAPDEYVCQFVCIVDAGVAFVEVAPSSEAPWTLWRVEGLGTMKGTVALITARCTEEEAKLELAAAFLADPG